MLRYCDSFDHYTTAEIAAKWTSVSTAGVTIGVGGRRSSQALIITYSAGSGYVTKTLDSQGTWIVGFAYKRFISNANPFYLKFIDNATEQVSVRFYDTDISVWSNGSQLGSTATGVLTLNQYYYVEVKVIIGAAGQVIVSTSTTINGNNAMIQVLDTGSCGTQVSGNASADIIKFEAAASGVTGYLDDMKILDGTGDYNNDLGGDHRVDILRPVADGSYSQCRVVRPFGVAGHYDAVDVVTPTTGYSIRAYDENKKDSFLFASLTGVPESLPVKAIQHVIYSNSDLKIYAGDNGLKLSTDEPSPQTTQMDDCPLLIDEQYVNESNAQYKTATDIIYCSENHPSCGIKLDTQRTIDKILVHYWCYYSDIAGWRSPTYDTAQVYSSSNGTNWTLLQTFNSPTLVPKIPGLTRVTVIYQLSSPCTTQYLKIHVSDHYLALIAGSNDDILRARQVEVFNTNAVDGGFKFLKIANSTEYLSEDQATLSLTPKYFTEINEVNPSTELPWTQSDLNSTEFGFEIVGPVA